MDLTSAQREALAKAATWEEVDAARSLVEKSETVPQHIRIEMTPGSSWSSMGELHPDSTVEIIAQYGTTIQIDGCDGAKLERDGRALAAAKSKTLSASGKPVMIRNPGKGLLVRVEE
jgi:hypothetical protein